MNVKNINPLERHVEKITLAVAAAGAAYMIWLAYPPLSIPGPHGENITPRDVEDEVSRAVAQLDQKRDETRKKGKISVSVPNFVDLYLKRIQEQPLPEQLVSTAAVPRFAPLNMATQKVVGGSENPDSPVATPGAPAPTGVSAISWVGVLMMSPPPVAGQPGAAPGAVAGQTADKHLVIVKGQEDLGAMLKEMANTTHPLPPIFQRAVIYRIEAQRRERRGDGWGSWEEVTPNPLLATLQPVDWPKVIDLRTTVDAVEQQRPQIANPDYFPLPDGTSIVQQLLKGDPTMKAVVPVNTALPPPTMAPAPGGWPGAGGPGFRPGTGSVDPRFGDRMGGRGAAPMAPGPGRPVMPAPPPPPVFVPAGVPAAAPAAAADQSTVPFWVLDDQVKPGREYQYQVRVALYNPTYRWPRQLVDPKMKDEPLLRSAWVMAPNSVVIKSDMYFFMMGAIDQHSANPRVSARIYKYSAGKWYAGETSAQPGLAIKARIRLGYADVRPAVTDPSLPAPKPAAPPPETEVDTLHTVVDVSPDGNKVVLLNSSGELETRDANIDRNSPIKIDIENAIAAARPVVVPATQPATRPFIPTITLPTPTPTGGGGMPGGDRMRR